MIIAIIFVASAVALAYGMHLGRAIHQSSTTQTLTSTATNSTTLRLIESLANAHWKAIAQKNMTAIMNGYSTGYEALWWYVNGTIGPTNGRDDCNIPVGPNNCSRALESDWLEFFNSTPILSYSVCNVSLRYEADGRVEVTATLWLVMKNSNETLQVPYLIDFQYFDGTWGIWRAGMFP